MPTCVLSSPNLPTPVRTGYVGRFAPSPTGPLHDGSLIAAMASFLDARAHGGRWLLRIEDIDTPRVVAGADGIIMNQLRALGMHWDDEPVWQSSRHTLYQEAFDILLAGGKVYGCGCTRQETGRLPYAGTCRNGVPAGRHIRAWRVRVAPGTTHFTDRWVGPQQQNVAKDVGDFILKRADGLWAYQLVVVVDDWQQQVTHIVRGADLLSSTARQRLLAHDLGAPTPATMHVPLLLDGQGRKVSKQNHAPALDDAHPLQTLGRAWQRLGFEPLRQAHNLDSFWGTALAQWASRFNI